MNENRSQGTDLSCLAALTNWPARPEDESLQLAGKGVPSYF